MVVQGQRAGNDSLPIRGVSLEIAFGKQGELDSLLMASIQVFREPDQNPTHVIKQRPALEGCDT
jgi:hypothetical protein